MKVNKVWIEIVLLGSAVALVLAVLLATVGAAAGLAMAETAQSGQASSAQVFQGMVTCSSCGAKHQPALERSATNCVRVCVHGGASFALVHDESVYLLDGEAGSLKRLAGQRARVTGTLSGNIIKVASIESES